jgi:predicted CopG family antitoxin
MTYALDRRENKKSKALSHSVISFFFALIFMSGGAFVLLDKITPKEQLLEFKGEIANVIVKHIKQRKHSYDVTHLYLLDETDDQVKEISMEGKYEFKLNSKATALVEPISNCDCYTARELYIDGNKIFDYQFFKESQTFAGMVLLMAAISCVMFGWIFLDKWRKLPDKNF